MKISDDDLLKIIKDGSLFSELKNRYTIDVCNLGQKYYRLNKRSCIMAFNQAILELAMKYYLRKISTGVDVLSQEFLKLIRFKLRQEKLLQQGSLKKFLQKSARKNNAFIIPQGRD